MTAVSFPVRLIFPGISPKPKAMNLARVGEKKIRGKARAVKVGENLFADEPHDPAYGRADCESPDSFCNIRHVLCSFDSGL
jgi:hypothetical protein